MKIAALVSASTAAKLLRGVTCAAALVGMGIAPSLAQTAVKPAPAAKVSEHVKEDIQRHRAMALAHDNAARCLESGRSEEQCGQELQAACKGLAIGKYCGMKHEH